MKIHKVINIDLEAARKRSKNEWYQQALDLFEKGRFKGAFQIISKRPADEKWMVPQEIWDILFDNATGGEYSVPHERTRNNHQ